MSQSVTFPAGETTENVVVPINSQAADPGLVPIQLTATTTGRPVKAITTTVYLASSLEAIPPSIIGVQRVAGGIAVTFSKPMDPATVENIHNYAVRFSPNQNFSLEDLYGVGLVQTLSTSKTTDSAETRKLRPRDQHRHIGSERAARAQRVLPDHSSQPAGQEDQALKAHPLTDLEGNILNQGEAAARFRSPSLRASPTSRRPRRSFDGN